MPCTLESVVGGGGEDVLGAVVARCKQSKCPQRSSMALAMMALCDALSGSVDNPVGFATDPTARELRGCVNISEMLWIKLR